MILTYLLCLGAYFLAATLTGHILISGFLRKMEVPQSILVKVLPGHLVITSLYALIVTQGRTYLIIPFVLMFLLLASTAFLNRSLELRFMRSSLGIRPEHLWIILGSILLAFLSMYFRVYDWTGELKKIHTDFTFYGGVSDYMNRFGVESLILDPLSVSRDYQPYHYFELWHAALFSRILGNPSLQNLMLITYPFHIALIFVGLFEYGSLKKIYTPIVALALLVLFTTPLGNLIGALSNKILPISLTFISENGIQTKMGMKLFGMHAVSVLYLYVLANREKLNFPLVIFLGILLFIYPTTVPFGGLFLLAYWSYPFWVSKRVVNYITNKKVVFVAGAIGLAMFAVFPNAALFAGYEVFRYLISFIFVFLLFILPRADRHAFAVIGSILLICIACTMFGIQVLSKYLPALQDPNIFQIISNFGDPFFLIAMIAIIMHFVANQARVVQYLTILMVIGLYFFQGHFKRTFMRSQMMQHIDREIIELLESSRKANTAFIRDLKDYQNTTIAWNIYYDIPLHNMRWHTSRYFPICMSLPSVEQSQGNLSKKRWYDTIIKQSSYYQFLESYEGTTKAGRQELDSIFIAKHNIVRVIDNPKR